jgi:NAD(P)-dependent dehydrogenase (short-subunit alcohol dehydrogenase family)
MALSAPLAGKTALVTGGAQGIGLGIVTKLLSDGAAVTIADVNETALKSARETLEDYGDKLTSIVVDLTDVAALVQLPNDVAALSGPIDLLINNAGIRSVASFVDHSLSDWQRALDVNLTAPFLLAQATVPGMIERGGGRIVNVTSVASELGFKNRAAYNVSKAGLTMLTKSIALELGSSGITCNAVAPGVIETPLNSDYFKDAEFAKIIIDATPAATWGRPADIAAAVAFLCHPEAGFVNGATILVDGGWSTGKGY